jgi:flagellar basal-body rod modification protein FlgD
MTTVGTTDTSLSTQGTQASGNPKANLDTNDFLKLFVAQMSHQDPMSPMDNNAMVSQMSALTSVEQLTNLSASNAKMASALGQSSAIALMGRSVTWTAADGTSSTGTVEKITTQDGSPFLTVDGTGGIDPSSVTQIA